MRAEEGDLACVCVKETVTDHSLLVKGQPRCKAMQSCTGHVKREETKGFKVNSTRIDDERDTDREKAERERAQLLTLASS